MAYPSDSNDPTYPQAGGDLEETQPLGRMADQSSSMAGDATDLLTTPLEEATTRSRREQDATIQGTSGWFTLVKSFQKGLTTVQQDGKTKLNPGILDGLLTVSWAVAAAAVTLVNPYPLQRLERQFQTALFELRGPKPVPTDVIILAIDDSSLDAIEHYEDQDAEGKAALSLIQSWPWERRAYAQVIDKLISAGARSVSLDITLASPSSYGPEDDQALIDVIKRYPGQVVLAEEYAYDNNDQGETLQRQPPQTAFVEAGALTGFINFIIEPNGRIHRLGREAIAVARQEDEFLDDLINEGTFELATPFAAATLAAADIDYSTPKGSDIFFHGPNQSFRHVPFWQVLDPNGWESLQDSGLDFTDKIILIGGTATILQDIHATPFGQTLNYREPMAGVEIQANAVVTLQNNLSLYDWSRLAARPRSLSILLLVLGSSWLMSRPRQLTHRLALAAMLALAWNGLSLVSLIMGGQILPLALPLLAIVGFGVAQVITVGVREQFEKQQLRNMLKSHASVPAIREILSQQDDLRELMEEREAEVVGKLLSNRYQVTRLLGTGGFSETYIAKDNQRPGSPPCVVKQLRFIQGKGNKIQLMRRLFKTEAETLEKLGRHNQIPRLLAYFDEEYEFYLVQELILGQSLHAELLRRAQLSIQDVIALLYDMLTVLVFVHDHNIIHRDIKPNNIIRRHGDQRYVLIDFGIAKAIAAGIGATPQPELTVAIGTQGYIPREQIAGRPEFSSDLYALGTTAIECLTGLIPRQFKYDEGGEICWTHRAQNISLAFTELISKLVYADAARRYPTAQAALEQLVTLPEFKQFQTSGNIVPPIAPSATTPELLEEENQATAETTLWEQRDDTTSS